jgi:hypothetical protein
MQDVIDDCEQEGVDVVEAIVNGTTRGPEGGVRDDRKRKWAPEVKPTQQHVAQIIAILSHLCHLMGWTLFELISDFRRYYHQWMYSPWTEWLVSMAWSPLPERNKDSMAFVRVKVLDMGITPASQITQFIAQFFLDKWYEVMDKITAKMEFRSRIAFTQWEAKRKLVQQRTGCVEGRPYAAGVYGDDPCFIMPEGDIAEAGIRAWQWVVTRYQIDMSKPHKWFFGAWGKWAGLISVAALGLMMVTSGKRALLAAEAALARTAETVPARKYHSAISRLKHYLHTCPTTCKDVKSAIRGLWKPLADAGLLQRKGGFTRRNGAVAHISLPDSLRVQLGKLYEAMLQCPGVTVLNMLFASDTVLTYTLNYDIGGDACVGEDTTDPGMAGSLKGLVWRYALSGAERRLPIAVIEFSVVFGNVEMILPGAPTHGDLTFNTDAATAAFDMRPDAAPKSEEIHFVRQEILTHPNMSKIRDRVFVRHGCGEGDAFDDAVSQKYLSLANELATQLQLKVRWIPATSGFCNFMKKLVDLHARQATQKAALQLVVLE